MRPPRRRRFALRAFNFHPGDGARQGPDRAPCIGRVRMPASATCRRRPCPPRRAGPLPPADVMLNRFARALFTRLLTPTARALLALGISPDAVTLVGTLGVMVGALAFYPRGCSSGARSSSPRSSSPTRSTGSWPGSGRSSSGGRSSTPRWTGSGTPRSSAGWSCSTPSTPGERWATAFVCLALACLVLGQLVSYARARAEGLGMTAAVGIAERADRLVAVLLPPGWSASACRPSCCSSSSRSWRSRAWRPSSSASSSSGARPSQHSREQEGARA